MNIKELLKDTKILNDFRNWSLGIKDISYDSRHIPKDCLFVCLSGKKIDGHRFAQEAIDKGASAILCEKDLGIENQIIVENSRATLSKISSVFFGNENNNEIILIGITGTKGKTTSSCFISKVLNDYGIKTCQIGTMGAIFGSEIISTLNTTPESYEIHKLLRKAKDQNFKALVIETSSIGLKEHRLDDVFFDYGIFTNLSNDHISEDEHKDIEDYIKSKSILFQRCKFGVLNCDDDKFNDIIQNHTCDILTYGFSDRAQIKCESFKLLDNSLGSEFCVNGKKYQLSIPGRFNIYNALPCICVCEKIGVPYKNISESLKECNVKGRSEIVFKNDDFMIVIDYAHNEDSLKNILVSLRKYNPKRLVVLFGAGGNRPKLRRYSMGRVAGKFADFSILTADNSRFENVNDIIEDIKKGVLESEGKFTVIPNRREAIFHSIKEHKKGDIILLAGKGHETYQEIGGRRHHFDEREIVYECLKTLGVL